MTVVTAGSPTLQAAEGEQQRPFGIYVHVPFCATRCGYCDFNTYTPSESGGANPDGWLAAVRIELELAAKSVGARSVQTVFVGGGTPSLLGGSGLGSVLGAIRGASLFVKRHSPLLPQVPVGCGFRRRA